MDLNKLNRQFYLKTQVYFNTSRQSPWPGWQKLLPYLRGDSSQVLKVLDLGCGNGRFGKFLTEHKTIDYTGIDNNQYLLDRCRKALPQAKLIKQDILKPWAIKEKFDLIVLFGVLHHIPGFNNRLKILRWAKKLLLKNGCLIFSLWQLDKTRRLTRKIVPWPAFLKQLEPNDLIIDWKSGPTAYRFCHIVDEKELKRLLEKLKMIQKQNFFSDGEAGKGNRYLILRK